MSAPGTHPVGDIWPTILDQYRCRDVDEGRRCQLYRDHDPDDVPHAHAAGTPRFGTLHRWADGRRWVDDEFPNGQRWCCMFAA